MRQEEKRRARNKAVKSTVRTYVTRARAAIVTAADDPQTEEAIRAAVSELDSAVSKGVLHRNNAARRKSRLMARLNAAKA
jgi:small subunit ribosomal protein S20